MLGLTSYTHPTWAADHGYSLKASIISNLRALGKKKQIYITPECELTAYYAEPLMSISNPATDETFRAEEGLNKTETFGETEEGFWG